MKLYLIRHTSVDVPKGVCYGYSNVGLKSSFPQEADKVLQGIEGLDFDAVFSSPLSRCTRLAHYCDFKKAILDVRLKELNFGDWEMKAWDEIKDPNLENWYQDWLNNPATNGESFMNQYQRFSSFMADLPPKANNIAVFTHGGIINCARVYAGTATFENVFDDTPDYGSVVELEMPIRFDQSKG